MAKYNKEFLGIEWTGNFIKIVTGIISGNVSKINIIGSYKIAELNDDKIVEKIKASTEQCQKISKTFLLVSRSTVIVRYLKLPSTEKQEIQKMVDLQVERHFPYSLQEMYYDFVCFETEKKGYSHIVLTAINKKECDRIIRIMVQSGLKPDLLSVSTWGIVSAYLHSSLYNPAHTRYVALIDTAYDRTEFIIMYGSMVLHTRTISNEVDFTLTSKQAAFMEQIIAELRYTLDRLEKERGGIVVNTIIVGHTLVSAIPSFKVNFSKDATVLSLEDYCKSSVQGNFNCVQEYNLSLLPISGMAQLMHSPTVNLLPPSLKKQSVVRETRGGRLYAAILAVCICLVVLIGTLTFLYQKYTYVKNIERELSRLTPEAQSVTVAIKRIGIINTVKQGQVFPLSMLSELYKIIPQNIFLALLEYDISHGVSFRGVTTDMSHVSDLLLILQKSPYFKNAEIKYAKEKIINKQERIDFEIFCPYGTVEK
ncbi:MAG: pilus assembly protein PilM [Candidatus Omnitrophica bacterium]|nr:pilus assembly protein PilM [Candidatus Omnitrophota bacterium]